MPCVKLDLHDLHPHSTLAVNVEGPGVGRRKEGSLHPVSPSGKAGVHVLRIGNLCDDACLQRGELTAAAEASTARDNLPGLRVLQWDSLPLLGSALCESTCSLPGTKSRGSAK